LGLLIFSFFFFILSFLLSRPSLFTIETATQSFFSLFFSPRYARLGRREPHILSAQGVVDRIACSPQQREEFLFFRYYFAKGSNGGIVEGATA
jgi:hypothetical protein